MPTGQACLWGLLGVALIEVYGLWSAITSTDGVRWPWYDGHGRRVVGGYAVAVVCRVAMGVGLNAVYAAAHQIDGPLGAVTMGIAAPLILKQLAQQRPEALAPPSAGEVSVAPDLAGSAESPVASQPAGGVDAL